MPVPDALTVDELKQRVDLELGFDDDLLEDYLEAAFELAQAPPPQGCGRLLTPDPAPDVVDDQDTSELVQKRILTRGSRFVHVPDAREITQVLADDTEIAAEDYEVLERNDHITRLELPRGAAVVKVTGRFGFAVIPESLKDAIYIMAARALYERKAQYVDQVPFEEGMAIQAYFRQVPPRTKLVFTTFANPAGQWGLA